jgi:hypothetical protein
MVYILEVQLDFGDVKSLAATTTISFAANAVITANVCALLPEPVQSVVTVGLGFVNLVALCIHTNSTNAYSNLVKVEVCINGLEACS